MLSRLWIVKIKCFNVNIFLAACLTWYKNNIQDFRAKTQSFYPTRTEEFIVIFSSLKITKHSGKVKFNFYIFSTVEKYYFQGLKSSIMIIICFTSFHRHLFMPGEIQLRSLWTTHKNWIIYASRNLWKV